MDRIYSRTRFIIHKPGSILQNTIPPNNHSKIKKILRKIMSILLMLVVMIITIMKMLDAVNSIIDKQCEIQAKSIATRISNEQATAVMSKYRYDDLFNLVKDSNGNVSMISANVITVNEINSNIAIKIQEQLNNEKNNSFDLRLGNLMGNKLFSGVGPTINVKIETAGSIETDLKSEFEARGINQTLHRMYLEVECNVTILTPYKTMDEKIINQLLLSEVVIMGTTPKTYFKMSN